MVGCGKPLDSGEGWYNGRGWKPRRPGTRHDAYCGKESIYAKSDTIHWLCDSCAILWGLKW